MKHVPEAVRSKQTGKLSAHEKRKARRAKERLANGLARSKGEALPFPPKRLPPEPVVFAYFDWARYTGNIILVGRRKTKYRLPVQRGCEIVGVVSDGRKLVRLPLGMALEVFGKA